LSGELGAKRSAPPQERSRLFRDDRAIGLGTVWGVLFSLFGSRPEGKTDRGEESQKNRGPTQEKKKKEDAPATVRWQGTDLKRVRAAEPAEAKVESLEKI